MTRRDVAESWDTVRFNSEKLCCRKIGVSAVSRGDPVYQVRAAFEGDRRSAQSGCNRDCFVRAVRLRRNLEGGERAGLASVVKFKSYRTPKRERSVLAIVRAQSIRRD